MFGQATGAIHVSIVDLILPDTPCFPFSAFQFQQFLQTGHVSAGKGAGREGGASDDDDDEMTMATMFAGMQNKNIYIVSKVSLRFFGRLKPLDGVRKIIISGAEAV